MYESPITIITNQMKTEMTNQLNNFIYETIQNCDVKIDKEELIKVLKYDRNQYERGYKDGYLKAKEMISVKDKLPTENGQYLVLSNKGYEICDFDVELHEFGNYYNYDEFGPNTLSWDNYVNKFVTHWQALPNKPRMD